MKAISIGTRGYRMAACVLAVAAGDWLFYERPVGWTLGLFALGLVVLLTLRHSRVMRSRAGRIALAVAGVMCVALVEEPTGLAILMAVAAAMGFLILLQTGEWVSGVGIWVLRWAHLVMMLPVQVVLDNYVAARWWRRHPLANGGRGRFGMSRVVAAWVLPAAGGVVFIVLFAVANPIISQWLHTLGDLLHDWLDWLPELLRPARLALWGALAMLVYGLLRHQALVWKRLAVRVPPVQRPERVKHDLVIRCLVVFNVIFAVQTTLDLIYLYGGMALPSGMTYAHYAHRGAYPLVATALLAGAFVLLTFKTGGAAHRSAWARRLVYLWIGQNVMLLASTIWRLMLYVDVYSLSRWRVATMIWIALVAVGFGLVVWKIVGHRTNVWLLRANIVSLGAVLGVCAFINFGGLIADFNVQHCQEINGVGVPLDVGYLKGLGPEALPALGWVEPRLGAISARQAADVREELQAQLDAELTDWRGWTWRRQSIARHVTPVEAAAAVARQHANGG